MWLEATTECPARSERLPMKSFQVAFVVGGHYGVSGPLRAAADEVVSLGRMTLPHELARVILLEQIYRAFCIQNRIPYHRER